VPHKPRRESSTRFYHIYVRGINKEKIFGQPREKNYFKRIIRKYLKEYDVEIYSYCIMSNHAHLLIKSDFYVYVKSLGKIRAIL
jgi:REP element-mobilizing transposase RayT